MARIAGVDLPREKGLEYGLTYIYGIGRSNALVVLEKAGVELGKRANDLTDSEIAEIRKILENEYTIEGKLRSEVQLNIKRLMDIASYRGLRHRKGLPVRGQRSKTNARTRKGRKKTIANKKK